MYLLNLNCKAWVFLFYGVNYRLVPEFVLLILLPHHIVSILNRTLDVFFGRPQKIELHDSVIFELALADEVESSLCF